MCIYGFILLNDNWKVRPANSPSPGSPTEAWEAGIVQEENETAEDSNAENLYVMGRKLSLQSNLTFLHLNQWTDALAGRLDRLT